MKNDLYSLYVPYLVLGECFIPAAESVQSILSDQH